MNLDDLDQTAQDATDKLLIEQATQSHALTWMNRSLAIIAAAAVGGLLAYVVLEGIDRLPAPPVKAQPVVTVTPTPLPTVTELPTPKMIDQYPILQTCVVEDEDNCWRPDDDGDGPGHAYVTLDGTTYWLDGGEAWLNGRG